MLVPCGGDLWLQPNTAGRDCSAGAKSRRQEEEEEEEMSVHGQEDDIMAQIGGRRGDCAALAGLGQQRVEARRVGHTWGSGGEHDGLHLRAGRACQGL